MRVLPLLMAGLFPLLSQSAFAQSLAGYEGASGDKASLITTAVEGDRVLVTITNPCVTFEENPDVPGVQAEPDPARKGTNVWNVCYNQTQQGGILSGGTLHVYRLGEYWKSNGKRLADLDFTKSDGSAPMGPKVTIGFPLDTTKTEPYCQPINFGVQTRQLRGWGSHPGHPTGRYIAYNKNGSPATIVCVDPARRVTMPPNDAAKSDFAKVE